MDSEHRHELQENALADWVAVQIERARPHVPAIIGAAIVGVLGILGLNYWNSSQADARAEAWRLYSDAMVTGVPSQSLLERASDGAHPAVADWSAVTLADMQLLEATNLFFTDAAATKAALEKAEALYKGLVGAADPMIDSRGRLGLARIAELQGDATKAIDLYKAVVGPMTEVAKERIERLAKPEAAESLAWLAEAHSKMTAPAKTGGMGGLDLNPDDVTLPPETGALPSLNELIDEYEAKGEPAEGDSDAEPAGEKAEGSPAADPAADASKGADSKAGDSKGDE